jgi:hypothetical protein
MKNWKDYFFICLILVGLCFLLLVIFDFLGWISFTSADPSKDGWIILTFILVAAIWFIWAIIDWHSTNDELIDKINKKIALLPPEEQEKIDRLIDQMATRKND